jgi:hypothetical protein
LHLTFVHVLAAGFPIIIDSSAITTIDLVITNKANIEKTEICEHPKFCQEFVSGTEGMPGTAQRNK